MRLISTKLLTAVLLYFLITNTTICWGQSAYKQATLITKNGTKQNGFIKHQSNGQLAQKIYFRSQRDHNSTLYRPEEIQAYSLVGLQRKFVSFEAAPSLKDTAKTIVFAEILVESDHGQLLYFQTKGGRKRFFVQASDFDAKELILEVLTIKKDGTTYRKENKKYVGLLQLFFKDCKTVKSDRLEKISLNIRSLSLFFKESCNCLQEKISFESSIVKDKGTLHLLIGAGISYTTTQYRKPFPGGVNLLENAQPFMGTPAGISLLYFPPNFRNTFFFGLSSFYHLKGSYSTVAENQFKQHYLNFSLPFGYQHPFGKLKPYLGLEFSTGILLNPEEAFISTAANDYGKNIYSDAGTEIGMGFFTGIDLPISNHGIRLEFKYHVGYMPYKSIVVKYIQHALQLQLQFRLACKKSKKQ